MLYIPCVVFSSVSITSNYQLPFGKKWLTKFPRGGARLWQGGANAPLPPLNETLIGGGYSNELK